MICPDFIISSTDFPVRSGYTYLPNTAGTFRLAASVAEYWSSRASSTRFDGVNVSSAYKFEFSSIINPSSGPDARAYAFPLRCLSTVLGM